MSIPRINKAYELGVKAGHSGMSRSSCPFTPLSTGEDEQGSAFYHCMEMSEHWLLGWEESYCVNGVFCDQGLEETIETFQSWEDSDLPF